MYLISSYKKGISFCQLARDINVTQKTAWYMLHKVRSLYKHDDSEALKGEVECDEVIYRWQEEMKAQVNAYTKHTWSFHKDQDTCIRND